MLNRRALIVVACILAATTLSAGTSPSPSPSSPVTLSSGTEGAKAALVRIELLAAAEIAHIDHSTGDVAISRGKSSVPLGSATGVLVSADGIVATTWENLTVDEGTVAVYGANELFSKVIGVPIVGNDGNPARRGSTPDERWAPHLQHCYDLVQHCVLFRAPQYRVRTYTSEPGSVMAELLNSPSSPQDVALLRISGGGGAPTATLADPDKAPGAESLLLGFTELPTPKTGPAVLPVDVDAAAGRITSRQDLAGLLDAGVSGGPVLDGATGQVLGLAGPRQPDGQAVLTPAAAIQAAMAETGVNVSPSKFDAVFRRGVDHLSSGNAGGSAESAFEESLTYYDSALATSHLEQARATRGQATNQPAAATTDDETAGFPSSVLVPTLVGILLVAGIIMAITVRRRNSMAVGGSGGASSDHSRRQHAATDITAGVKPKNPLPATEETGTVLSAPGRGSKAQDRGQQSGPVRHEADRPGAAQTDAEKTRTGGGFATPFSAGQSQTEGPAPAFCSQCGRPVSPGARYCVGCGHPVG